MKSTFGKSEKLKSKELIGRLFTEGKTIVSGSLQAFYLPNDQIEGAKLLTAISVSKRNFKKAVARNRIKRLLREAYRRNKAFYFNNITTDYALMILYIGKTKPSFEALNTNMNVLLEKLSKEFSE